MTDSIFSYPDQGSPDIDGGYTAWSEWTECSKTCGGGIKGRERSCTNPKPDGNGKDCTELGPAEETAACNEQACPDREYETSLQEICLNKINYQSCDDRKLKLV